MSELLEPQDGIRMELDHALELTDRLLLVLGLIVLFVVPAVAASLLWP